MPANLAGQEAIVYGRIHTPVVRKKIVLGLGGQVTEYDYNNGELERISQISSPRKEPSAYALRRYETTYKDSGRASRDISPVIYKTKYDPPRISNNNQVAINYSSAKRSISPIASTSAFREHQGPVAGSPYEAECPDTRARFSRSPLHSFISDREEAVN